MNRKSLLLAILFCASCASALALAACGRAERRVPLPGDSVASDGSVSLAPPRLATNVTNVAPERAHASRSPRIESRLFPAELVMEHVADIALTRAQQDAITKELDKSQAELVSLQWDLGQEKDKLVKILDDAKVDEGKSRQAATALMQRENAIKASHLGLLVRIKNILTPEQQNKLRTIREADRCAPGRLR